MKYYVTLKYEETIEVEAATEDTAIFKAQLMFDPTSDGPILVEVWSDEEEEYHEF
jgi:hypothetical protein